MTKREAKRAVCRDAWQILQSSIDGGWNSDAEMSDEDHERMVRSEVYVGNGEWISFRDPPLYPCGCSAGLSKECPRHRAGDTKAISESGLTE